MRAINERLDFEKAAKLRQDNATPQPDQLKSGSFYEKHERIFA